MIQQQVLQLLKDAEVAKDMPLQKGQEIEIVMDVVYINGFPVPPALQKLFMGWIKANPELFKDITKNW